MVTQRIANPCRKTMQVRVLSLTPNTGLRKVWLIRLLWEQEIVGSNPTAPTNNTPSDDEWGISALITLRRKTELVRFQPLGPYFCYGLI